MMIWIRRLIIIRNCCSVGVASSTLQFRRCLWTLKYYFFIHSIESLYRGSNSFHMHAMILVRWTLQEMKVFLTYNCQSNILAYIIFDLILHKWKKKKKTKQDWKYSDIQHIFPLALSANKTDAIFSNFYGLFLCKMPFSNYLFCTFKNPFTKWYHTDKGTWTNTKNCLPDTEIQVLLLEEKTQLSVNTLCMIRHSTLHTQYPKQ